MKSFTDIFVRRPVLAIVVNLLIILAGLQAIRSLSVRQYPRSDNAAIEVRTAYVGADADLVRGFITSPLERAIASVDGVDYIQSTSAQGLSTITAQLKLNFDSNAALTQVQTKIAQVRGDLPPEAESPAINLLSTDARIASMYLSFYSQDLDQNQITDYLTRVVQPKLSALPGVQQASILGARTFAMRIWLKPDRLAAFGISPSQVRQALAANNYLAAVGSTKGSMTETSLVANTTLKSAEEFQSMPIGGEGDSLVRLGDVADVVLGAENYESDVRFDGQKATFMGIYVLPNANVLDVTEEVRAVFPEIQRELPAGMQAGIPYDSTKYINNAITEVIWTLGETLLIVVIVIYLFLGSLRSVLVPVVAIPISLIGAVFLMMLLGFTINLLTLLAIVLSVGLVVDDAIVVVENVERHIRRGLKPLDAALLGARELVGPIIAMTITLAAVYTPIAFQGGLTGALFREFALTLSGAVAISGVVALTLSPMMSGRLIAPGAHSRGFEGFVNGQFEGIRRWYERQLSSWLQTRGPLYFAWAFLSLLVLPALYILSPQEPAPAEDQGIIFSPILTPANSTLDQTVLFTEKVYEVYRSYPETANTFQVTETGGGFSGMVTKPWNERRRSTLELVPEVGKRLAAIPGVRAFALTPPALPGGGSFPVEIILSTADEPQRLAEVAQRLHQAAVESGLFMFPPDLDLKFDLPQTQIVIDRDKVAVLGLNLQQVGADLAAMIGGSFVNRFSIEGRSYKVIPQVVRSERLNPEQLLDLQVSGPGGKLIPVSTFATLQHSVQPRSLARFQQLNSAKIAGVPMPPNTVDSVLSFLEQKKQELAPAGYFVDYTGESRFLRKEGSRFLPLLGLALLVVFLVIAAQFESFRDPLIVLLGSVPLALFGSLLFTFLRDQQGPMAAITTSLNIYSKVGLITLVGLIAKNGILIVEFANKLQEQGRSKVDAVREAAATRLRPILMTSAATVFGHFPLVLASGPGAGARNSIGIVLCAGMTIGTLFTLFVVPAIYVLLAKDRSRGSALREAESI